MKARHLSLAHVAMLMYIVPALGLSPNITITQSCCQAYQTFISMIPNSDATAAECEDAKCRDIGQIEVLVQELQHYFGTENFEYDNDMAEFRIVLDQLHAPSIMYQLVVRSLLGKFLEEDKDARTYMYSSAKRQIDVSSSHTEHQTVWWVAMLAILLLVFAGTLYKISQKPVIVEAGIPLKAGTEQSKMLEGSALKFGFNLAPRTSTVHNRAAYSALPMMEF